MKIGVRRAGEGEMGARERGRKPPAGALVGALSEAAPLGNTAPSAAERAMSAVQRRHEAPLRARPATSTEIAAAIVEGAALPLEEVEAELEKERALAALAREALQPTEPAPEPALEPAPERAKG